MTKLVSDEVDARAIEVVKKYLLLAASLYPSFNRILPYGSFTIVWMDPKEVRRAGMAYRGSRKIELNPNYINESDFWETTIAHEVAHHVQYYVFPNAKQAHGPEFRLIMKDFGLSQRTHHRMKPVALCEKFHNEYQCPRCGEKYYLSNLKHSRMDWKPRFCCNKSCKKLNRLSNWQTGKLVFVRKFEQSESKCVDAIVLTF